MGHCAISPVHSGTRARGKRAFGQDITWRGNGLSVGGQSLESAFSLSLMAFSHSLDALDGSCPSLEDRKWVTPGLHM